MNQNAWHMLIRPRIHKHSYMYVLSAAEFIGGSPPLYPFPRRQSTTVYAKKQRRAHPLRP